MIAFCAVTRNNWPMKYALAVLALFAAPALADPAATARTQAVEILRRSVAFETVEGRGHVPAYAVYLRDVLIEGGFAASDIEFVSYKDTGSLIARYRGKDQKAAPILVTAHMDVVDAKPEDWKRPPFTMTADDTFFYGRGVLDNKFDLSMVVATVIRLKAEGFTPKRDIVLVFSGDEETVGDTAQMIAPRFKNALFMLNTDAGGGALDDAGKPIGYGLQAAEKTYADFRLTVTDPGGHSSRPGPRNAIYVLSQALLALQAKAFAPQVSEISRGYFAALSARTPGPDGAAMAALAKDPKDAAAIARLSGNREYIGQLRTTCVATQLAGGHAPNALPQTATATINCRIMPGVAVAAVQAELAAAIANPEVAIDVMGKPPMAPASPLRADVLAAVKKAVSVRGPGVTVSPQMSAGATDSVFYRAIGIPSYGVSGLWMNPADDFAHGLNERAPKAAVAPAIEHWHTLLRELAGK